MEDFSAAKMNKQPLRDEAENWPLRSVSAESVESSAILPVMARTAGALLIVIGVIALVAWGVRRLPFGAFHSSASDPVKLALEQTLPLGDKQKLVAVRFADATLLLGVSGNSMTVLATKPEEEKGRNPALVSAAMPGAVSVAELLEQNSLADTFPQEVEIALSSYPCLTEAEAATLEHFTLDSRDRLTGWKA